MSLRLYNTMEFDASTDVEFEVVDARFGLLLAGVSIPVVHQTRTRASSKRWSVRPGARPPKAAR